MGMETVHDVLGWYASSPLRAANAIATKERLRLLERFRQACGSLRLEDCRPAHLWTWIEAQTGVHSDWTRKRFKSTICRPFNLAFQLGLIAKNPFAGLQVPQGPRGRDWTHEEYQSLLRHSPPHVRRLVVFIRLSGARPGEARKLRWDDIHAEIGAIIEAQHKTAHRGGGPRRIYLNHVIVKLLAWLRRRRRGDYVFVNGEGRPWTITALTHRLRDIRARAGLPASVKLHGGRHTFATCALTNGVDLATLAELLGHSSIATTQHYLHLVDKREHLNAAAERAIQKR